MFFETDVASSWSEWAQRIPSEVLQQLLYVFHFASPASPVQYKKLPLETLWANSIGLGNAIGFAQSRSARVIFASTSEIYGDPQIHPQPESYWGHVNSYGERSCYDEAKRFGEALIYSYNQKHKSNHGIVRIFNTYGPRMSPSDGRLIINFLKCAQEEKPLTIYGNGQQTRTFCYVSDLIAGVIAYAKSEICEPLNLGGTDELTVLEVSRRVQRLFGDRSEVEFCDPSKDDPQKRKPDLTKSLEQLYPWCPKVSFDDGLKKMADWICLSK